eukprot:6310332-Pyramimonas_sp.AAC.1
MDALGSQGQASCGRFLLVGPLLYPRSPVRDRMWSRCSSCSTDLRVVWCGVARVFRRGRSSMSMLA